MTKLNSVKFAAVTVASLGLIGDFAGVAGASPYHDGHHQHPQRYPFSSLFFTA